MMNGMQHSLLRKEPLVFFDGQYGFWWEFFGSVGVFLASRWTGGSVEVGGVSARDASLSSN